MIRAPEIASAVLSTTAIVACFIAAAVLMMVVANDWANGGFH